MEDEKKTLDILEEEDEIVREEGLSFEGFKDVIIYPTDLNVDVLTDYLNRDKLYLNPYFQRRNVWTQKAKSAFIESLILNVPIPSLLLANSVEKNQFIVVDGKQRLLAIKEFCLDRSFKLNHLNVLKELNGKSYSDLKSSPDYSKYLSQLENYTFRCTVIKNYKIDELFYIFSKVNTASVPLSPQELRASLFPGNFLNHIVEYSDKSKLLKDMLKLKEPDNRMRDVEIVLRYFSFKYFLPEYTNKLKEFFNNSLKELNLRWECEQEKFKKDCEQLDAAIKFILEKFDSYAFRLKFNSKPGAFNRPVFDLMTYYFSEEKYRRVIVNKNINIKEEFFKLLEKNDDFKRAFEPSTHDPVKNNLRFDFFHKYLESL